MLPPGSSSDTSRRICTDWMDTFRDSILSMDPHHVALHFRVRQHRLRAASAMMRPS